MTKWDDRLLKLAEHVSQWSKDPSTKVGACIVDDNNRVISHGYNGFPKGVDDSPAYLNDREQKLQKINNKKMMEYLLSTPEFTSIFMKDYLTNSLNEMVYREGASDGVAKEINARKNMHDYIYAIISEGEYAVQQLKG